MIVRIGLTQFSIETLNGTPATRFRGNPVASVTPVLKTTASHPIANISTPSSNPPRPQALTLFKNPLTRSAVPLPQIRPQPERRWHTLASSTPAPHRKPQCTRESTQSCQSCSSDNPSSCISCRKLKIATHNSAARSTPSSASSPRTPRRPPRRVSALSRPIS